MPWKPQNLNEVFKPAWEIGSFEHLSDARSFAIENGWKANPQRVQIRFSRGRYYIEPYEQDCNCPNVIKPF